jgi:outer membrane receptor protein involved in Fe transport
MNPKLYFKIFLFLFLLSLPWTAYPATISGFVKDSTNGEPLQLVNVFLQDTYYGSTTNKEGYYVIQAVPAGEYTLTFSMMGYEMLQKKVALEHTSSIIHNAKLVPATIEAKGITVSARRTEFEREAKISAVRLSGGELRGAPSFMEGDLFRSIGAIPGVVMASDFSTALYVRGGGPEQNLILLDGVTVYNPFHLGGFFSTFDIDAVKSAELLAGGFPAEYGGRLSAVLDVTTKAGNENEIEGNLSVSSLSSKLLVEGPTPYGTFFISGRRTYFDKLLELLNYDFPYYFYDVHAKTNFRVSDKTQITLAGFFNNDNLDFDQEDISVYLSWGNRTASLSARHIINPRLFTQTYLTYSKFGYSVDLFNGIFELNDNIHEYGLKSNATYFYSEDHEIKLGLSVRDIIFDYLATMQGGFGYDIHTSSYFIATYLQDQWKPSDKFIVKPGVRLNYFTVKGEERKHHIKLAPRLNLKYFISPDLALNFAYGKYFQFLTVPIAEMEAYFAFIYQWIPVFGEYKPEEATHYILGAEKWLSESTTLTIETYYKDMNKLLDFNESMDPDEMEPELFIAGRGYSFGLDILLKKDFGEMSGWLGYSLGYSKVKFDGQDYHPFYDRRHDINAIGIFKLPKKFNLSLRWTYGSGLPYTELIGRYRRFWYNFVENEMGYYWDYMSGTKNAYRFPAYHRMDLGLNRSFSFKGINGIVQLGIINLYNQQNVFMYYWDQDTNPPEKKKIPMFPILPSLEVKIKF